MTDYQAIVDAEWRVIYEKLEKIVATGAKVVLSKVRDGVTQSEVATTDGR